MQQQGEEVVPMSKDWTMLVANPDAIGDKEKELGLELQPILNELLEELKKNGKIETVYIKSELDGLESMIEYLNKCSMNHNHKFRQSADDETLPHGEVLRAQIKITDLNLA